MAQEDEERRETEADTEDEDDEGLTDEARSRGGKRSAQEQERDEQGRFVGKD